MAGKSHSEEVHQKAFHAWYDSKNMAEAARQAGVAYATVHRWSEETFPCEHGCPWHGWNALAEARDKALKNRLSLLEQGNVDPLDHDVAVHESSKGHHFDRKMAFLSLIRSDIERIAHLEVLYGAVFYQLTGIPTGLPATTTLNGEEVDLKYVLENAPKSVSNMERGISALQQIVTMIEDMKQKAGVVDKHGQTKLREEIEEESEQEDRPLALEDLRKLKKFAENTSPDRMIALRAMLDADEASLEKVHEYSRRPQDPTGVLGEDQSSDSLQVPRDEQQG